MYCGRCLSAFLVCLAALSAQALLPLGSASAHGDLLKAEPAPYSILAQPPSRVTVWFTEPVEPRFSQIQVIDERGNRVDNRDKLVEPADSTVLAVTLPVLPNGIYTVAWTNMSTVDGHVVRGLFVFSIGVSLPPPGAPAEQIQPLLQSPLHPFFRWLELLGLLSLVGGLAFQLIVCGPVFRGKAAGKTIRRAGGMAASRSFRLTWLATGVFLVGSAGQLLAQTSITREIGEAAGNPVISVLTGTDWGRWWFWRVYLFILAAVTLGLFQIGLTRAKDDPGPKVLSPARLLLPMLIACGSLLTLSFTSHGAALARMQGAAISTDYLHLLAAALWAGGLFHFALAIPVLVRNLSPNERLLVLAQLASRFSTIASLSVGTLIITGLYSSLAQVATIRAMTTPYGLTLLAKFILIAFLFCLGALNLLWVRPRLGRETTAVQWLRRFVTAEAVLAAILLLPVGLLTSLEPGRQAVTTRIASEQPGLILKDVAGGANVTMAVRPGRVGPNNVTISLVDLRGNPINNALVILRFNYLNTDIPETTFPANLSAPGNYTVENVLLSIAGSWQADLIVAWPGAFDTRNSFVFEVSRDASPTTTPVTLPADTGKFLWYIELVLLALMFGARIFMRRLARGMG